MTDTDKGVVTKEIEHRGTVSWELVYWDWKISFPFLRETKTMMKWFVNHF